MHFNPHPRTEGDWSSCALVMAIAHFNPHPRTEGDRPLADEYPALCDFNPHPRTEGDVEKGFCSAGVTISTHTLARRVTGLSLFF